MAAIHDLPEWQECRTTIGRFDIILADLRKYGFTLVTVLLVANALIPTPTNAVVNRVVAAIVVMLMLLVLFMIDNFYWALLLAAVKKAMELETPGDHLTGRLSVKAQAAHATALVLAVYAMYVLITAGIAFAAVVTAHPIALGWLVALVVAVLLELAAMFTVYGWVEHESALWLFRWAWRLVSNPASVMRPAHPRP